MTVCSTSSGDTVPAGVWVRLLACGGGIAPESTHGAIISSPLESSVSSSGAGRKDSRASPHDRGGSSADGAWRLYGRAGFGLAGCPASG
jgi:hypothetical protein